MSSPGKKDEAVFEFARSPCAPLALCPLQRQRQAGVCSACRPRYELHHLFEESSSFTDHEEILPPFKPSKKKLCSRTQRKCGQCLLWMEDIKGNSTRSLTTRSVPPQTPCSSCHVLLCFPVEHPINNMCKSLARNITAPPDCWLQFHKCVRSEQIK